MLLLKKVSEISRTKFPRRKIRNRKIFIDGVSPTNKNKELNIKSVYACAYEEYLLAVTRRSTKFVWEIEQKVLKRLNGHEF